MATVAVPRVARAWPPDEPSAKLLDCPRCGCTLLHSEYVGRPTSTLDAALIFHHSGACAIPVDERHARSLERWLSDPTAAAAPWPDGEPPLVFCARRRMRTLALKLLDRPTIDGGVDGALRDGLTALHLAALGRDEALVSALLVAGASARCRSGDGGGRPGGRTALHCAAEAGAPAAIIDALLAAAPESVAAEDWEGCTPAVVAALSAHDALARTLAARQLAWCAEQGGEEATVEARKAAERELMEEVEALAGAASERALRARLAQLSVRERARAALNIDERPLLHDAHVLRGEVSAADCDWLLGTLRDAIAVEGWASARHKFHPTVDYPVARCPAAAAWMRRRLAERIFPAMAAAFGLAAADLRLHECFVVRYEPGGQPALELHKDGTLLSCNFLLNRRAEFGGGATCFAAPVAVHEHRGGEESGGGVASERQELDDVDVGDVVLHCGQLLHGASPTTKGVRYLLVCFVDVDQGDLGELLGSSSLSITQAATETVELEALAAEFEAEQRARRASTAAATTVQARMRGTSARKRTPEIAGAG